MSEKALVVKQQILEAYQQMTQGCGNTLCLNPFCKTENKSFNEIALECISMSQNSPDRNLIRSGFIFCEKVDSEMCEDFDEAQVICKFSDLVLLGCSFALGKSTEKSAKVDYKALEVFYERACELVQLDRLSPKWVEQSLQSLQLTTYNKLYLARVALIILAYPLLYKLEHSNILILLSSLLSTSLQSFNQLSLWMNEYSQGQVKTLNSVIQKVIASKVLQNLEDENIDILGKLLKLLECLYKSNEKFPRVPYSEFYNEIVNNEINLKTDFKNWYLYKLKGSDNTFAFGFFPWILDPNSKSQFLMMENTELMRKEIHNSVLLNFDVEIFVKLHVRRESLVQDTISQLLSGEKNIKKPLKVHFIGEEGVDEGGIRKEFFQLVVKDLFDPEFNMFTYYESTRLYWFNPDTIVTSVDFEIIGMILGMAIYNSTILYVGLPMAIYKKILGVNTTIKDLAEFNPQLAQGLTKLLEFEGDVENTFCRNFVIETKAFGEIRKYELVNNGKNVMVNNENRQKFVDLYVDWWLNKGVSAMFEEFKKGFLKVCGGEVLKMFKPEELELLICGNPILDFKALEAITNYEGFSKESITVLHM